jgi:hypothetical protein
MSADTENVGREPEPDDQENRLRAFLLRLAESPALRDRFIFDPITMMAEAPLDAEEQELLLTGDERAINARVWPDGNFPVYGPIMEIDIVDSEHGRMPLVLGAVRPSVRITTMHRQALPPGLDAVVPTRYGSGTLDPTNFPMVISPGGAPDLPSRPRND